MAAVMSPSDPLHAAQKRKRSVSPDGEEPRPRLYDVDPERRRERERQMAIRSAEAELEAGNNGAAAKPKEDPKAEMARMALTRGGGTYIPPHRMRAIMGETAVLRGGASPEFQRLSWDALRKSINGLINKVNTSNIKQIVPELFGENLIRGRGLYCRSIMRAQAASLPFSPVFAALTAIINTKLPQIGELLVTRLVSQFRRSFKRNDKPSCIATTTFLGQLVNQQVAHEIVALQILILLLEQPTGDSVEIAVGFMREVGAFLAEAVPKPNTAVFERFRAILHESGVDKRVQYMIEVLFQVRREKFKDNPIIPEGLDLVEEEDTITHRISLDDELVVQDGLNVFKVDSQFEENEAKYKEMKREILGDSDDDSDSASGSGSDAEDEEEDVDTGINADGTVAIHDQTETNLVNLRRTIYLTIMSALDFEEAVHKLLKMQIRPGQESELCNMIIECCSQERSYSKFYGLMGERLCKINQVWSIAFEGCFKTYYDTIHRYETNRLRNVARFFGHLFSSNAIPWSAMDVIRMTEDDTTSSSRIFVKIIFEEMVGDIGLAAMKRRFFEDPALRPFFEGLFPKDHPKNTRFSINFFTSIQLGALTEDMREHLKSAPALLMAQQQALAAQRAANGGDDSDSDSSSSLSSSSLSSSLSESSDYSSDDSRRRRRSKRSPPRRDDRRSRDRRRSSTPPRRRDDTRRAQSSEDERSPVVRRSPPRRDDRDRRGNRVDSRDRQRSRNDDRDDRNGRRREDDRDRRRRSSSRDDDRRNSRH